MTTDRFFDDSGRRELLDRAVAAELERDEWKALAHSTEETLKQQQGASIDQLTEANRTGQAMGEVRERERIAAWLETLDADGGIAEASEMQPHLHGRVRNVAHLNANPYDQEPDPVAAQLQRLRAMPDGHVGAPALPEGARCTKLDIKHGWDDDGHGFVTVSGKYAVDSGVPHLDVMDGLRAVLSKEARTVEPRDTEPPRREAVAAPRSCPGMKTECRINGCQDNWEWCKSAGCQSAEDAVVGKPEPEGLDCGKPVMMGHGNDYQCEREPGHNGRCGELWEGQELGERALAAEAVGKPSTWEEAEAGEGGAEFEAFVTWWADYKTGIAFSPEEQDAAWEAWSERADRSTPAPEPALPKGALWEGDYIYWTNNSGDRCRTTLLEGSVVSQRDEGMAYWPLCGTPAWTCRAVLAKRGTPGSTEP